MASIDGSDDTQKSEVEELMSTEVAKSIIVEAERRPNVPAVIGQVRNNRGQTLQLLATTNWTGSFFTAPPGSVVAGDTIRFSHNGSSGAVIYGQQRGSSNAAAYLLAWSMGRNPRFRKVYVKCGPISEVHYNGWENAALTSLNSSKFDSSDRHDGTSSSVLARIDDADARGIFPLGAIVARFN